MCQGDEALARPSSGGQRQNPRSDVLRGKQPPAMLAESYPSSESQKVGMMRGSDTSKAYSLRLELIGLKAPPKRISCLFS